MSDSFQYRSGLGRADAYLVSGKPFAKGGLDSSASIVKVTFPAVTRWVRVINQGLAATGDLKCAFSENGLPSKGGTNYFTLQDRSTASSRTGHTMAMFELKITEMYFEGSNNFDVIAGLTSIGIGEINVAGVANWSGSAGVG
tara:strand:+ start:6278 stop:6703 length:426 start_codon:yes stop_codon:yes gene_type:complete